jgi:hypothetical protein
MIGSDIEKSVAKKLQSDRKTQFYHRQAKQNSLFAGSCLFDRRVPRNRPML